MRCKPSSLARAAGCSALLLAAVAALAHEPIPSLPSVETVYLDAPALERLRATNPNRYARVQRILAAANHLCRARAPEVYFARFGAQDLSCAPMILQTSNPPKWRIGFRIDETRYIASIVVTDNPPRLLPAR
jgi:hypothetical protein